MYHRQTVREVSVGSLGYHIPDVLQADCKGGICGRSGVSYTTLMYYRQTVRGVSVGGLGYYYTPVHTCGLITVWTLTFGIQEYTT